MAKVLNKFMGFWGLDEDADEEDDVVEEKEEYVEREEPILTTKKQGKVVSIHSTNAVKVVISKPKDYDEATSICDDLKNRKIIVVNTCELEAKTAQRLLDFMGGASYVLGGEFQEVERGVYVLSPSNVEVSNELKTELTSKGIFNWSK